MTAKRRYLAVRDQDGAWYYGYTQQVTVHSHRARQTAFVGSTSGLNQLCMLRLIQRFDLTTATTFGHIYGTEMSRNLSGIVVRDWLLTQAAGRGIDVTQWKQKKLDLVCQVLDTEVVWLEDLAACLHHAQARRSERGSA